MFYRNQRELLIVVGHRCKEMLVWQWAMTTVKCQNEGSGSMERNVHFFRWQMDRSAAQWWWQRRLPNQPHISSKSQLLDRGPLTQSFRVPEEPADSYSNRPCSTAFQQQVLQAHFECGCYASPRELHPPHVSLCLRSNMNVLKDSKHNLCDKVVFLRRHSWRDDLKRHLLVDMGECILL